MLSSGLWQEKPKIAAFLERKCYLPVFTKTTMKENVTYQFLSIDNVTYQFLSSERSTRMEWRKVREVPSWCNLPVFTGSAQKGTVTSIGWNPKIAPIHRYPCPHMISRKKCFLKICNLPVFTKTGQLCMLAIHYVSFDPIEMLL